MTADVPSPIDLLLTADAREWEQTANAKRPSRPEFFARFASEIEACSPRVRRVLELGSGPGFLAEHLLAALPDLHCVLLDFSAAMHELARRRLGPLAVRAEFVEHSFKQADWTGGLGPFECVVTMQAVHELRHKRYAPDLHTRVRELLSPSGVYLVCDHFVGEDGMSNDQLFMSIAEQRDALLAAGFSRVEQLMVEESLVLHRAM